MFIVYALIFYVFLNWYTLWVNDYQFSIVRMGSWKHGIFDKIKLIVKVSFTVVPVLVRNRIELYKLDRIISKVRKQMKALILIGLIFSIYSTSVQAAPPGYDKYGELAEEIYYDDLSLLAQIVWCEAGNQDLYGKELVADVVLNRLDDPNFPDTISEVIFQPGQFHTADDYWMTRAAFETTEECIQAVANEILDRNDSESLFFCSTGYNYYGTPNYQYRDHYFSK